VVIGYAIGAPVSPPLEDDLTPEEHTFLVQIHESIPMLREDLAVDKDTLNNVAGTGPMNEYQNSMLTDIQGNVAGTGAMNGYQNDLLNQILAGVNDLLQAAGKQQIQAPKPPG
jgi:hypothetical protein